MKTFEASTIRVAIQGENIVQFFLRQEVPGRVFYICQCREFRSPEVDLFADVDATLLEPLKQHVRESHETREEENG
jgi:predicted RNA-binding protein YlxR (DUF448 family)